MCACAPLLACREHLPRKRANLSDGAAKYLDGVAKMTDLTANVKRLQDNVAALQPKLQVGWGGGSGPGPGSCSSSSRGLDLHLSHSTLTRIAHFPPKNKILAAETRDRDVAAHVPHSLTHPLTHSLMFQERKIEMSLLMTAISDEKQAAEGMLATIQAEEEQVWGHDAVWSGCMRAGVVCDYMHAVAASLLGLSGSVCK